PLHDALPISAAGRWVRGRRWSPSSLVLLEGAAVLRVPGPLGGDLRVGRSIDVVEHRLRAGGGEGPAVLAGGLAERVGGGLDLGEERVVGVTLGGEVRAQPDDGGASAPVLLLGAGAVARRVVGGGVGAHPVGVGLDEGGAAAAAGAVERLGGDRVAGQHVVAVHPHRRDTHAGAAAGERHGALPARRHGDRPLVVLADEDDGRVVDGGEDHRLVDVALGGGAVAEVDDDGAVALGVAGADVAVALHAHGGPGRVQCVGPDDEGVDVEVVGRGVSAAVLDAAEDPHELT